jgi:hypothetical protein
MADIVTRQSNELLNSWKEISAYIGRGVRTVQRWERDFGLPVRRPGGHVRGSVIAMRKDIDEWLATRSARQAVEATSTPTRKNDPRAEHLELSGNISVLRERYCALVEENRRLRENLRQTIAAVQNLRQEMMGKRVVQLASGVTIDGVGTAGPVVPGFSGMEPSAA